MIVNIFNTDNKYDVIYTDPAWQQCKGGLRKTRPKQTRQLDYQTCTVQTIQEIQAHVATLCNDKHNVFMWTIDKYLHKTEQMMSDIGYSLHARFISKPLPIRKVIFIACSLYKLYNFIIVAFL